MILGRRRPTKKKGPMRASKAEADADLDAMRAAASRDDVARVAEGLRASAPAARKAQMVEELRTFAAASASEKSEKGDEKSEKGNEKVDDQSAQEDGLGKSDPDGKAEDEEDERRVQDEMTEEAADALNAFATEGANPAESHQEEPWFDEVTEIPEEVYLNPVGITLPPWQREDFTTYLPHRTEHVGFTTTFSDMCPSLAAHLKRAPTVGNLRRRAARNEAALAAAEPATEAVTAPAPPRPSNFEMWSDIPAGIRKPWEGFDDDREDLGIHVTSPVAEYAALTPDEQAPYLQVACMELSAYASFQRTMPDASSAEHTYFWEQLSDDKRDSFVADDFAAVLGGHPLYGSLCRP